MLCVICFKFIYLKILLKISLFSREKVIGNFSFLRLNIFAHMIVLNENRQLLKNAENVTFNERLINEKLESIIVCAV